MKNRIPAVVFASAVLVGALAAPALAQNREHMQLFADLRMLQEQVTRLQLAATSLEDQIKTVTKRLDDQAQTSQREFADQRLLINGLTSNLNTVREKLDDNAIAVRQLTPEVSAIRTGVGMLTTLLNQMLGLLQPPTSPAGAVPPGAETTTAPPGGVTMPPSPAAYYNQAMSYFASGQLTLAIQGFQDTIETFPNATDYAADSQFFIGDSYYQQGKYRDALTAYGLVISKYKDSKRVPDAYYQQGVCYEKLGQRADAIRSYKELMSRFAGTTASIQAVQAMKRLGVM